jgi:hypothetical protein
MVHGHVQGLAGRGLEHACEVLEQLGGHTNRNLEAGLHVLIPE